MSDVDDIKTIAKCYATQNNEAVGESKYLEANYEKTYYFNEWTVRSACTRIKEPNQMFVIHENKINVYNLDDGTNIFHYAIEQGKQIHGLYMLMIGNVEHMVQVDKDKSELKFYSSEDYSDVPFDNVCCRYALHGYEIT